MLRSYKNTSLCKENKNNDFIPHFRLYCFTCGHAFTTEPWRKRVAAPPLTKIRRDDVEHMHRALCLVFNVITPDLGQHRRMLESWYCRECASTSDAVETKTEEQLFTQMHAQAFDSKLSVVMSTDAFDYKFGVVFSKIHADGQECTVALSSITLTPAIQKYSTVEKETLVCLSAVKRWRTCGAMRLQIYVAD